MNQPAIVTRVGMPAWMLTLAGILLITACGGGGGTAVTTTAASGAVTDCSAEDNSGSDDCGDVYIGLTDAPGDFVTYSVNVSSLRLERADGLVVETLPVEARVDFARYVDLTEFLTAASVPAGRYVAGTVRLDYSDADIVVETATGMAPVTVTDESGNPLAFSELEIVLDDSRPLIVRRGFPAVLTVDFDLAASHEVNLDATPVTAVASPFLLADVDPVESKPLRLRGPLLETSIEDGYYRVTLRPFHLRHGDFGRNRVYTGSTTVFDINGVSFEGDAGLAELATLAPGTPTLALGTLDLVSRRYRADEVYAGSSVPGFDFDGVSGNVIHRSGNTLTVLGAAVVPRSGRPAFRQSVVVLVGDQTRVFRTADRAGELDIAAISTGQKVRVLGELSGGDDGDWALDATAGQVGLLLTRLHGTVTQAVPGQLDVVLQSIDRHRAGIFDFAGTGISADADADPGNYEIATTALDLANISAGAPVGVAGYVNRWAEAPPDFAARTVADFSDARALLAIGWPGDGTGAPFSAAGPEGLLVDVSNPDLGTRHHIRQGAVFTDLLVLPVTPLLVPDPDRPGVFAIRQHRRVHVYANFDRFVASMNERLDQGARVRSLDAIGGYDAAGARFEAARISIRLH